MGNKIQYGVIVSDRARQMFASHILFVAQKGPAATRKTKDELINAIRSLSTMPRRYPFLNAEFIPPNKYHKMLVEKWYLILYQIKGQTVYVDYIVNCRRDYDWLLC